MQAGEVAVTQLKFLIVDLLRSVGAVSLGEL